MLQRPYAHSQVESPFAWLRLAAAVMLGSIGTVGMWSVPVVLPLVQFDFGVARADASLPFTLAMLGFAFGGVLMGRLADRFGVAAPVACGAAALGIGYVGAALAHSLLLFALMHLLIGLGTSATFGPIMADASRWFTRRRGIAVALAGCGNYLGGAIWPPVLQYFMASDGWRATFVGVGAFCTVAVLPLLAIFARRAPAEELTIPVGVTALESKAWALTRCLAGLCYASPGLPAASPWPCRRFTSWPIAAISATASRGAPKCSP